ncbi:MAG TPA: hypothetical protein VMI54_09565 [Polyangiaceae bacterium]|nr:hypothetical protein [Polyangiaceae bacterium]
MLRLLPFVAFAGACASAPPPAPVSPAPPAPAPSSAVTQRPAAKPPSKAPEVVPAAVPPPPAVCAEYVARMTSGCAPPGPVRAALAAALVNDDAARRDTLLACLEPSEELPFGSVHALRAELAPEACGDALVTPLLESPAKPLGAELESALVGLMLSARFTRLLADPPKLEGAVDKQRFRAFFVERLSPWVLAEAAAIEKLSAEGARLSGYGRGVAAIAAGNADLRFVQMVRDVPLPDEMKADQQVVDAYYGELDQALEPRKVRGRDAALVGLRTFAELGAIVDPRVTRARALLNALWAGSHIEALDRLILPPADAPDTATPEVVLAARLPTFYTKTWLAELDPSEPKLLRALLERGVPAAFRAKLDAAKLSEPARVLYARALVQSGRQFFRASDFKRARSVLGASPPGDLARLLAALAQALEDGPADATELMLKGPFVRGTGDVSALDAEAARHGRFAGYAALDAALVLALAPKQDDAAFWDGIAKRFDRAEKLLATEPRPPAELQGKRVREFGDAARATAAAVRAQH